MVGDYAATIDPALLMEKQFTTTGPTPELARLAGVRLAVASEGNENERLASGLIKRVTGDQRLSAAYKYENNFEFDIQFKLLYQTNDIPRLNETDEALKRRLVTVPFNKVIPKDKRDDKLLDRLKSEAQGIISKIALYASKWHADGLPECRSIEGYCNDIWNEQDTVQQFIEATFERCSDESFSKSDFARKYHDWCKAEGIAPLSKQKLNKATEAKGYTIIKSGVEKWQGLRLKNDEAIRGVNTSLDDL